MLNLGDLLNLIKYPSLTEKSINLYGDRQYTFIVDRVLTKTQIKYIIEKIFKVEISQVNTCFYLRKQEESEDSLENVLVIKKHM